MKALTAALEPEFGTAKVFRPYRDVRFAKDKTPYKTHQGAFVGGRPATGWYVEISAARHAGRGRVLRRRRARASPRSATRWPTTRPARPSTGSSSRLEKDGFEVGGEQLKTSPRGYDTDHPRIHLLRRKQLFVGRSYGFEADAIDAGLVDRVRDDWKALRPLVSWLRAVPVD